MKNWYAVYTKSGCEKKVADAIGKKNWQAFMPITSPKKGLAEPVFPNLVFVNILESALEGIKQLPGVLNFFYWLQKPAVIRDIEIEMMRRFLSEHCHVQIQKMGINCNDIVKLLGNKGAGNDETDLANGSTKELVLPSVGYILIAEMQRPKIEVDGKKPSWPVLGNVALS